MIGIVKIAHYMPNTLADNVKKEYQGKKVDSGFVENKIGFVKVARKAADETVADMCERAFLRLKADANKIDCICLCTQNGDYNIPHTSAVLQHRLGLRADVAAFDVSLGCSGYVYVLNLLKAFMEFNNFQKGLLFTCDPYSEVIDPQDKNTDLLFGDAATVTLLGEEAVFDIGKLALYTDGGQFDALIKQGEVPLYMDGRRIFNFASRFVPEVVRQAGESNGIDLQGVDLFIFHQASKYIVENLARRMKLDSEKAPFLAGGYGNTVSSSIPLVLEEYFHSANKRAIVLAGFGVGLSVAATVIKRRGDISK